MIFREIMVLWQIDYLKVYCLWIAEKQKIFFITTKVFINKIIAFLTETFPNIGYLGTPVLEIVAIMQGGLFTFGSDLSSNGSHFKHTDLELFVLQNYKHGAEVLKNCSTTASS